MNEDAWMNIGYRGLPAVDLTFSTVEARDAAYGKLIKAMQERKMLAKETT